MSSETALNAGQLPPQPCSCGAPQRHGSDEEAGVRRRPDDLPGRAAGVGPTGDPHQPGVRPRLGGTYVPEGAGLLYGHLILRCGDYLQLSANK